MSIKVHRFQIALRFFDMDVFGHINNARYLTYFEEARIKFIDDVTGWKYGWSSTGIIMAHAEIDFIRPGHFKDVIYIETRCTHVGTKSFTLEYKMIKKLNGEEILLATAKTVIVMYDYEKQCSILISQDWREKLS